MQRVKGKPLFCQGKVKMSPFEKKNMLIFRGNLFLAEMPAVYLIHYAATKKYTQG